MKVVKNWAEINGRSADIESFNAKELDEMLQFFFAGIKKKNGEDYEPNSLCAIQAVIDSYLKEKGYMVSILNSREFENSRSVLEGKPRLLRENGKGRRPTRQ